MGIGGRLITISAEAAEKALQSLLGMAVDYKPDLDGHDPQAKNGLITGATIAKGRIQPKDEWAIADIGDQKCLILSSGRNPEIKCLILSVVEAVGLLNEIVAAEAGAVVKTIGDAVMATFPTPDRAVAAALRMRIAMSQIAMLTSPKICYSKSVFTRVHVWL